MSAGASVVAPLPRARKRSAVSEDFMLKNSRVKRPGGTVSAGESPVVGDHDPPIDLVHLARQCQGDRGPRGGAARPVPAVAGAEAAQLSDPGMGLKQKRDVAHKLRGSALTIGARRVARAAEAIEALAGSSEGEPRSGGTTAASVAIRTLQAAVAEAIGEIERLRGG